MLIRVNFIKLLYLICLTFLCLPLNQATAQSLFSNDKNTDLLQVLVIATDETGESVPYATVWNTVMPRPQDSLALSPEDLWRITQRYQSSFEFATQYNSIVSDVHVSPMANIQGQFKDVVDYKRIAGYIYKRPSQMMVSYTFMKRGYLPAQINFSVTSETQITGKVVLKRDPNHPIESQPYLQRFEQLRYELSDTRKDENISENTAVRNQKMREEFEKIAAEAIAANDKPAAARIYMRMVYLPSIEYIGGQPAGWSHQEPSSDESLIASARAYELDPENPYIAAKNILGLMSDKGRFRYDPIKASDAERQKFENHLMAFNELMLKHKEEIWPRFLLAYISRSQYSNNPKTVSLVPTLFREFYEFEPKYVEKQDIEKSINLFEVRQNPTLEK